MKMWAAFLVTVLLAIVAFQAIALRRKNINAFVRSGEYTAYAVYYCLFVYTVYACTFGWPYPAVLGDPLFVGGLGKLGRILSTVGVIGYAVCTIRLRDSYRIGIDTTTPGPLVTSGIFAHSRNPLYISLAGLYLGLFCIYANVALLFNFVLSCIIMHRQALREEKFLLAHYKEEFLAYCEKVPRYF